MTNSQKRPPRAFIAASSHHNLDQVIDAIRDALVDRGYEVEIFLRKALPEDEIRDKRKMMRHALRDIDSCDILVAEMSDKAVGVGIEMKHALDNNKAVVGIRAKRADKSSTMEGILAIPVAEYDSSNDIPKLINGLLDEHERLQEEGWGFDI